MGIIKPGAAWLAPITLTSDERLSRAVASCATALATFRSLTHRVNDVPHSSQSISAALGFAFGHCIAAK